MNYRLYTHKNKLRNILTLLVFFIMLVLIVLGFRYGNREIFPLIITLGIISIFVISYFYFEKSSLGTKEMAIIATLSAFAGVARVPFAAIPNVQPTTFIVAISGYVFGPYEGFLIGSLTAFISNIFLGQGPWTPWQMLSWGIVGIISGLLGIRKKELSVEKFSVICFLYGFLFDWIMNLWHIIGFVKVLNFQSILFSYLSGIMVDVMHSLGNFLFSMVFYNKFLKVLTRFKKRLYFTYIKE
ncbi:ECF transporter S component [Clostridium niameyense]|uniref:ECF transporter S component n=1 Tax=Clostridium niameyense TaxID=1622073 RepID=UPI000B206F33|nr:ECF transporter S component [Clostridium niameyense]